MTTTENDVRCSAATEMVKALCSGDVETIRRLFSGPADIDDPFAGHHVDGGFEQMVRNWRPLERATIDGIETTSSTTSGSFNATEITVRLRRDGSLVSLPVVVVSEFGVGGKIVKSRLYYRRAWIDSKQHHRWPICEKHTGVAFSPVLAAYQKALAEADVEGMMATFGPDFHFDGHGQSKDLDDGLGMGRYDRKEIRAALTQMFHIGGKGAPLEHLTVIDDGKTTVLEFNLHQGVPGDPRNLRACRRCLLRTG